MHRGTSTVFTFNGSLKSCRHSSVTTLQPSRDSPAATTGATDSLNALLSRHPTGSGKSAISVPGIASPLSNTPRLPAAPFPLKSDSYTVPASAVAQTWNRYIYF